MHTKTRSSLMRNIYSEQAKATSPDHINNLLTMKQIITESYKRTGKASRISYEDLEGVV